MAHVRWDRAALGLLALSWMVLAVGLLVDRQRGGPDATIQRYLIDLEQRRVAEALSALSPEVRERWRDFLEFQQHNRYDLVSIAVRSPSILESLGRGVPWQATEATVVADITEPSGVRWRGSSIVPVAFADGRWYLRRPPFAPP